MTEKKSKKLCVFNTNNLGEFIITLTSPLKLCIFQENRGFIITRSSDLYFIGIPSLEKSLFHTNIFEVSCNLTVVCFLTITGDCFISGEDPEHYGLLGISDCFNLSKPTQILKGIISINVSLGLSHGGIITDDGKLYTWGTGIYGELGTNTECENQLPIQVESTNMFMIKQLICGYKFTCFCTAGGFVYLFGELQNCSYFKYTGKQPYAIKGLEKVFVSKIEVFERVLAIESSNKDIYIIDGCLEPMMLPEKYNEIASSNNSIYGFCKQDLLIHE